MPAFKCRNWTFIPDSQELTYSDGRTEQLPSRISGCLLALITSAGKTVSYDELLQQVWGTTHKDASTISSVISEVRKLIGCGQNGKKIIVTVPKRGYRFTESVKVLEGEAKPKPTKEDKDSTNSTTVHKDETAEAPLNVVRSDEDRVAGGQRLWIAAFVVAVVFVAFFSSTWNSDHTEPGAQAYNDYEVVTHDIGREDEFDVSKDGRWLAYVNIAPNEQPSLVIKELATGRIQKLTATGDNFYGSPVFSHDAKQLVFHKQTKQQCEVWLADFSSETLDASNTHKLTSCGKSGFWSTLDFSKEGDHVYFARANALTDPYKVYKLDLRTGFERSVTSPTTSGRGDYGFSLSPDGQRLAVVRNVLWQESHIVLSNTADDHSEKVLELPYLIARVGWLSNEQLVYCDKNETLWVYDIARQRETQLAQLDFSCSYPVVAQDSLFTIKKNSIENAIWSLGKDDTGQFAIKPLIDSPYYDFNAMFGPGNSLYFMSDRSGEKTLWQKTAQGYAQHKNVELPDNARDLEYSIETNTLYGLSEKRLFRYDLELEELEWLSKDKHEVFNFSITDHGQLLFSEGNSEYWTLKSLDLVTLKITTWDLNAFSARQANGMLYFSKFHEKGLWRKDLQTGDTVKFFADLDIKFNTFWDIWNNEQLIWATDNRFQIYDLHTGQLVSEDLTYEGHVGFLKCNNERLMCTFSFRENEESEVVQFN